MTFAKTAGLIAGFVGAVGLGIAVGPSIVDRHADAPSAIAQPAPATADIPAPAPAPARRAAKAKPADATASASAVVVPPAAHPELYSRLKPVLNRGANMEKAADGFRNAEEFATVAHAARESKIPFMLLKHRVLEEGMTLDQAVRASKSDVNSKEVVAKARAAAKDDLKALQS